MVMASAADGTQTRLHGSRIIIATGSRPLRPASVPFDDPCVFDSETITGITHRPGELAASDVLAKLHPDVLRAMHLPSRAHRI
jgi:hypothetical protein